MCVCIDEVMPRDQKLAMAIEIVCGYYYTTTNVFQDLMKRLLFPNLEQFPLLLFVIFMSSFPHVHCLVHSSSEVDQSISCLSGLVGSSHP